MHKQLADFLKKYEGEGCRFVSTSSISEGKNNKAKDGMGVYKLILAMAVVCMVNLLGACSSDEVGTIQEVKAVEEVKAEKQEKEYMETENENVKVVYSEVVDVKEVYYDESYKNWYVVCDGWALEGTEETAKNAVGKKVVVEFYVMNGEEKILRWGAL